MESTLVYKYTKLDKAKKILDTTAIEFTNPKFFNDPFDCSLDLIDELLEFKWGNKSAEVEEEIKIICKNLHQYNPTVNIETFLRNIDKDPQYLLDTYRKVQIKKIERSAISCFSMRKDNMLMWSHYANSHYGVCLEFDIATTPFLTKELDKTMTIGKVDYGIPKKVNYLEDKKSGIKNIFLTKSTDWEYEQECRIILLDDGSVNFNPLSLKKIIFGYRVTKDQIDVFKTIYKRQKFDHVTFSKVEKDGLKILITDL